MHLRNIVFKILNFIGLSNLLLLINRNNYKVPILLFHRVSPLYDHFTEPYSVQEFEKIILFLKKHYTFKSLNDLHSEKIENLKRSAFIVFDDGLKDFYSYAYPILRKHQIPVTMFACSKYLETQNNTLWNYQLFNYILSGTDEKLSVMIDDRKIKIDFGLNPKEEYKKIMDLHDFLLTKNSASRKEFFKAISKRLKLKIENYFPLMEIRQLKEIIINPNVDIQSHTHSHPYLPSISLRNEIVDELSTSKEVLSKILNKDITSIAYPNGGYNENILNIVRNHYKYGYVVDEELVNLKALHQESYLVKIPRFNITDKSPEEIIFRINGFHKLLKRLNLK